MHDGVLTPARRAAGFTLVELLMTVTLLGIVVASVAGVALVTVRTTATAQTRLDESNDLVRAATYFGDDVQGAQSVAVDAEPSCGTDAAAVLELTGQDFTDGGTPAVVTTVVTYVLRGDDTEDGTLELHRLACRAASAEPAYPLTPVTDVTVASGLTAAPQVGCDDGCDAGFTRVDLTVTRADGLDFTLTGRRRTTP